MLRFVVRVPVSNRVASPAAMVKAAQLADELGFYGISAHDRLLSGSGWIACGARDASGPGDDRDVYEPLVALSYLAAKTSRVRLLTSVLLLPLREVILLAKQLAVLDALSGGRLIVGVGVGARPATAATGRGAAIARARGASAPKERAALRVPPRRGRMADEMIGAMRAIWSSPRSSYAGDLVRFEDIQVFPKPVQPEGPPILIGGVSDAALRRVARLGDGWIPNLLRPEEYRDRTAEIERLATAAGRRPSIRALNAFTCVASTDAEALEVFSGTMGGLFSERDLLELNLVGSASTVVERLKRYEEAGVGMVEMKPIYRSVPDLLRMMELVAREIMPAFAS